MATAYLVQGLAFGDEGKGTVTDSLTRKRGATLVVRFNGGSQAAHNVLADGQHHTFAQFGSGTLAGARTVLSKHMLVNPGNLLREGAHLVELGITDAFDRIVVDSDALVTTPVHIAANRRREVERGTTAHGTCGMGIGETVWHAIEHPDEALRVRDLANAALAQDKLMAQMRRYDAKTPNMRQALGRALAAYGIFTDQVAVADGDYLSDQLRGDGAVIFEGAQGVLLDQDFGFHPHTTWSDCTFGNALSLLEGTGAEVRRIGVLRSYFTRHGAGPFPSFAPELQHHEPHNDASGFQGAFRQGHFDMVLANYALRAIGGVDEIAITHMDRAPDRSKVCVGYDGGEIANALRTIRRPVELPVQQQLGEMLNRVETLHWETMPVLEAIREHLRTPIGITSHGPTHNHKVYRV